MSQTTGVSGATITPPLYTVRYRLAGTPEWSTLLPPQEATRYYVEPGRLAAGEYEAQSGIVRDGATEWGPTRTFTVDPPVVAPRPSPPILQPAPAPAVLDRVELRSDYRANDGEPLLVIPAAALLAAEEEWSEDGTEFLHLGLPLDSPHWPHLQHRRVCALVFANGTVQEWRIGRERRAVQANGVSVGTVRAEAPILELADTDLLYREEGDGSVTHSFGLLRLTPAEHLAEILKAAPGYWHAGTIESTEPVDVYYQDDNALSAVYALAEAAGLEVDWSRNGTHGFLLHLVEKVGASAPTAQLAYRKNLLGVEVETDSSSLATVVYPLGANEDGVRAGIQSAAWEVVAVDGTGTRVTLPEGAIGLEGQYNQRWAEKAGTGQRVQVTGTLPATNQLVLSAPLFAAGDVLQLRADARGRHLTYLENPEGIALWGRKAATVLRDDLPDVQNILPNGYLDRWAGGAPYRWHAVGALAALRAELSSLFIKHGSGSIYLETDEAGAGLESDWVPYTAGLLAPSLSMQAVLFLAEGAVRMEFEVQNAAGETQVWPPAGQAVWRTLGWADNWGVSPDAVELNLQGFGATRVRARVVNNAAGKLRVYLDAAMLTARPTGADAFVSGRNANELVSSGIEHLKAHQLPALTARVAVLDLYRSDPDAFRFDALHKGGRVRVQHHGLGLDFHTRIVRRKVDHLRARVTEVDLDTRAPGLTGRLSEQGRRSPRGAAMRPGARGGVALSITQVSSTTTHVTLRLTASSSTGQRVALYIRGDKDVSAREFQRQPAAGWMPAPFDYELTVERPAPGKSAVVVESYAADEAGAVSPVAAAVVDSADQASIASLTAAVEEGTGRPSFRVDVDSDTAAIRYAYHVGDASTWPSDADVEAGTVLPVAGSLGHTLDLTVPRSSAFNLRVAPYRNADGTGPGGATDRGAIMGTQAVRPAAVRPKLWILETSDGPGRSNLTVRVEDPQGAGRLYVWTAPASLDTPDPDSQAPDGHADVDATLAEFSPASPFTRQADGAQVFPLASVRYHAGRGKAVFAQYESESGESTGIIRENLLNVFDEAVDELGRTRAESVRRAMTLIEDMVGVLVADTLPADDAESSIVYLVAPDGTGQLYRWQDGTGWVRMVRAVDLDGQVVAAQIANAAVTREKILAGAVDELRLADGAVNAAKFAAGVRPVETVGALPASGNVVGRVVVLTSDQKLYRWTGSAWTAAVPAADISGQIGGSQIADAAVSMAKFAAGIRPVEIVSALPSSGNVVGRVVVLTSDNKLYRWTGSAWTAAVPTADLTGTITSTQITDSAITTPKIAAGAVTAGALAATAVTAEKIAANAVTAGTIAAGAVSAREIAAKAITSDKLLVGIGSNLIPNGDFETGTLDGWRPWLNTPGVAVVAATTPGVITGAPGRYVVRMQASGVTTSMFTHRGAYNQPGDGIPVNAGEKYLVQIAHAAPAGTTGVRVIAYTYLADDSIVSTSYPFLDHNGSWRTSTFTYTAPAAAVKVQFYVYAISLDGLFFFTKFAVMRISGTTLIEDGAITTVKVAANAITAAELAADSVVAGKIAAGAVTSTTIAANQILATHIAAAQVSASHIVSRSITGDRLVAATITANELSANSVTATAIAGGTITGAKIAADTITAANLAAGAVTASELAANAVYAGAIQAGAIQAQAIAAGAVTATAIAANAISATHIDAGAVTAPKLNVGTLAEISTNAGIILSGRLQNAAGTSIFDLSPPNSASPILKVGNFLTITPTSAAFTGTVSVTPSMVAGSPGAALNADPGTMDLSAWETIEGPAPQLFTNLQGPAGERAIGGAGIGSWFSERRRIPVDATKTYRVRCHAVRHGNAGSGAFYLAVRLFNASGVEISGDGTWWHYAAQNIALPTNSWGTYTAKFGSGTAKPFPTGAAYMSIGIITNYNGTGADTFNVQDPRIEEAIPGTLIRDGSITAAHLSTITLSVEQWIQSANYAPGVSGWRIDGAGNIDAATGTFRGTVTIGSSQALRFVNGATEYGRIIPYDFGSGYVGMNVLVAGAAALSLRSAPGAQYPGVDVHGPMTINYSLEFATGGALYMRSSDGKRWRLVVGTTGTLNVLAA
jgi:hypothetical protein